MSNAQRIHVHINTLKATRDIAEGQELFIRYGSAKWFKCKNMQCADVDYASTMWRPDLHRLPRRRHVAQMTRADGRRSYGVLEAVPSGTVLEISLCLNVSLVVVDQFPSLWDFVLTGETQSVHAGCQPVSRSHTNYVFADQGEGNTGERADLVLDFFISPLTLFQS